MPVLFLLKSGVCGGDMSVVWIYYFFLFSIGFGDNKMGKKVLTFALLFTVWEMAQDHRLGILELDP